MGVHLWVRAESRESEERVGITPVGVAELIAAGFRVTVEDSSCRAIPIAGYRDAGAAIAAEGSWVTAPTDAVIFGLKELPDDGTPLVHRHVMFGHAFKGQADGPRFLSRFRSGGGALYDLEYLTAADGRRVAAFGYWAGYAGAAVGLMVWAAQQTDGGPGPATVGAYAGRDALIADLKARLDATARPAPSAIIIGALGRVGTGAGDLLDALGAKVTRWDMAETASGGPFPEIMQHDLFVNCVLAMPGIPVFVPKSAVAAPRRLTVIADVSCDPSSEYNPVPIYAHATSFADPVIRVADAPPLDVMAIDNLPSMLPVESSEDFARQLLDHLKTLDRIEDDVWGRARAVFDAHVAKLA
jgi:saccharopine dehydrogenase (NAD+, L-lysine-forming)